MLELTTIKQTALDYLLSNLEVFPEHRHLFEVVGAPFLVSLSLYPSINEHIYLLTFGTLS
ncbi:MAG: hypothetical protein F6K24_00850 [Okeania sp. SIO2D1]|nr:hypothetical protein [Okeania sp. SIO2D1]